MGQPKKQRRKYSTPSHMFKGRDGESDLVYAYGLKNMRELWKAKSEVARIRGLARKLLAVPDEKTQTDLIKRLIRTGLLKDGAKLEDILDISVENILDRRLQTATFKQGLTLTIKQARQAIVHGHIAVAGRRMTAPGHTLTLEEAAAIEYYAGSKMGDIDHPARRVEKKASTEDKAVEEAPKEPKAAEPEVKEAVAEKTAEVKEAPKAEAPKEPEAVVKEAAEVKEAPKAEAPKEPKAAEPEVKEAVAEKTAEVKEAPKEPEAVVKEPKAVAEETAEVKEAPKEPKAAEPKVEEAEVEDKAVEAKPPAEE